MDNGEFLGVLLLCIINVTFMVVGISLNSVVIISLWKSSQLRRKLCYFMILVLSCFDLAVVVVTHPFLVVSTIYFSPEEFNTIRGTTRIFLFLNLYGLSMIALFTLNVERFLAITCPFFYQASVTKARLVCFEAFFIAILVGFSPLYFICKSFANIVAAVFFPFFLFFFVCSNYKLFVIAKSKRRNKRIVQSTMATSTVDKNVRKRILNLKNISTCSLAVCCFFFCSSPQIAYSTLRLASDASLYDKKVFLFHLWSCTFTSMNSTFNCLIFFWRNSILRREGFKIVNALRARLFD